MHKNYFCRKFMISSVCIYCASSNSIAPIYGDVAIKLANMLVDNDIAIRFGAGNNGLMAKIADTVVAKNKEKITGIIPRFMYEENWHHTGLSNLVITETMHERKQLMVKDVDAVIALPGGIGTLEELLEIITWKQLGIFLQPIIIVNTNNYFSPLLSMINKASEENFMRKEHLNLFGVVDTVDGILKTIEECPIYDISIRKFAAL